MTAQQTNYFRPTASAREIELEAMLAEAINAYVAQADYLRSGINNGRYSDAIRTVAGQLLILEPIWKAVGYGHKARELKAALVQRCDVLLRCERDYLDACRKNDRTRAGTEKEIAAIEAIRAAYAI